MSQHHANLVLKQLYDAFSAVEKPNPLTTFKGSNWDEDVRIFNKMDFEKATYSDFCDGMEGWIICPPETVVYLLPRLLRMIIERRSGEHEGAVDNLSDDIESRLTQGHQTAELVKLLNKAQKVAVVDAFTYLDNHFYYPSNSQSSVKIATALGVGTG